MANFFNGIICESCGQRPATKRLVTMVHGISYETYICEQCAFQYMNGGVDSYVGMLNEEVVCPTCGTRLADVTDSAYLGCSDCYEVFRQEVLSKIQALHNTRKHTGKRLPKTVNAKKVDLSDRENMKEQLFLAKEEGRLDDAEEIFGEYLSGGKNDD